MTIKINDKSQNMHEMKKSNNATMQTY